MAEPRLDVPSLIKQYSRRYGVDPQAALSVARTEGGTSWGAVGDQGSSFGPYQLHRGGALGNHDAAWANSPAGLEFAIRKMAESGARGLKGRAAIAAIVNQFERPADPNSEISKAWGYYGQNTPQDASGATLSASQPNLGQPPSTDFGALIRAGKWGVGSSLARTASLTRSFNQTYAGQTVPGHPEGKTFPRLQGKVPPAAAGIVQEAYKWLGTPYSWGGGGTSGPSKGSGRGANTVGFDCSSFLQYVCGKQGVNIPRVTYDQWRTGTAISQKDLQPGDAVFFHPGPRGPEHVGMYISDGKFMEAPYTGAVVRISSLAGRKDYLGARRYS